jgi:hypothetical protein
MTPASGSGWRAGLAALALLGGASRGTASEIVTSQPGTTVVGDALGDVQLANCERARPTTPCTIGVGVSRRQPGWVDIASAAIRQLDAGTVELSMTLRAPIPQSPSVPVLVYYWQFQNGCNEPSPTDKDGVNAFWNGRRWSARWFMVQGCAPRLVSPGASVPVRFEGRTVTVRVPLADLVTRGGAALRWFAATRLLLFQHPVFPRTLPVDTAPDVVTIDAARPDEPGHPEPPASWVPR